jgi:predicted ATPase/DNA-binding SARP family transcriptional activator
MQFGILGSLTVRSKDDCLVAVPGAKVRGLLASLLVHDGEPASADRLIDDVWGERPPRKPAAALHNTVWQLRRTLEDAEPGAGGLVLARPPGYALDLDRDMTDVDARMFERLVSQARSVTHPGERDEILTQALGLFRGPVLAEFADAPFAQLAVARLEEQRLVALEDWAAAVLDLGDYGRVIGCLGDLLVAHPFRERLRAAHMRALYGAGCASEALASFDAMRAALDAEFGIEPGPEVTAVRQAILLQDERLTMARPRTTAVSAPATNLPAPLSALIGRDHAVDEVRALLANARLVTLVGIGGVGKTRLALAVAGQEGLYRDGVWLIEFGALDRTVALRRAEQDCLVVDMVAAVLGIRDQLVRPPSGWDMSPNTQRLAAGVRTKEMLLILDNCEHVAERVAAVSELLLNSSPGIRILATSREPLGISGERLWTVPPLTLPTQDRPLRLADAAASSAIQAFVACVTASAPGFTLTEENVGVVETICRRLDGLPLALELAATRVRALGLAEVSSRLDDRFALLVVGRRRAPNRQQTLRATIDWSWSLLTEPERVVLRRLSVSGSSFAMPAAEYVCSGQGIAHSEVMHLVANLVDRCLVTVVDISGVRRYRLPESVASYGAERLREAGEVDRVSRRHLEYYLRFAERASPHLRLPEQRRWLELVDLETANLHTALDIAIDQHLADLALRLVNALGWYWFLRGRHTEAGRSFTDALAASGKSSAVERASAQAWLAGFTVHSGTKAQLYGAGDDRDYPEGGDAATASGHPIAAWFFGLTSIGWGDPDQNERRLKRALRKFRDLGDEWGTAAALAALALQALLRGDLPMVDRHGSESAALFRDIGDRWGELQATDALASLAEIRGDYELATRLHWQGLQHARDLGLWTEVSLKLCGLGRIALLVGDLAKANELHVQAASLAAEQGYQFGEMFAGLGLGILARREGRLDAAQRYLRPWLQWCRQHDSDSGLALIYAQLGFIAEERGDAAESFELHRQGLEVALTVGDPRAVALASEGLAGACAVAGRYEQSALLLGAAAATRDGAGAPLPAEERHDVDRIAAAARSGAGVGAFEQAFVAGYALDAATACNRVLETDDRRA